MKKITILVLSAILAISVSACGRKDTPTIPTTPSTAMPTTQATVPTTMPMPTLETNIPDSDINTEPQVTDDMTGPNMDTTEATDGMRSRSRGLR